MIDIKAITPKILKSFYNKLCDVFAKKNHTHTKSEISDFPTSLPANGGNSNTVNTHTVNSDVPSNAKFTDTTYPIYTKFIGENFASKFRTSIKGDAEHGGFIAAIRNEEGADSSPVFGSGIAFGVHDTHGYLYFNYAGAAAYVGAGNQDKLNWLEQLAFKKDIPSIVNNLTTTATGSALDAAQGKALNDSITSLKKSVSDGKSAIASAITTKGVSTSSDASFSVMASNIKSIQSKPSKISTLKSLSLMGTGESFTSIIDSNYSDVYPIASGTRKVSASFLSDTRVGDYVFYNYQRLSSYSEGHYYFNLTVYNLKTGLDQTYSNTNGIGISFTGPIIHY